MRHHHAGVLAKTKVRRCRCSGGGSIFHCWAGRIAHVHCWILSILAMTVCDCNGGKSEQNSTAKRHESRCWRLHQLELRETSKESFLGLVKAGEAAGMDFNV